MYQHAVLLSTVSCEEKYENQREPSLGCMVGKHFALKTLQESLCSSCNVFSSIVMKKDNAWEIVNRWISLNRLIHLLRSVVDTRFLLWLPVLWTSVHFASKFLDYCHILLSLKKVSPHTLLSFIDCWLHCTLLHEEIKLQHTHWAGETIVLGILTWSLCAQNWQVQHGMTLLF